MKFLLIGDRHNSESIPTCRTDDFFDNCNKKDSEIIKLAIDNDVDAILHPGDFWTDADKKLNNDFVAKVANKWNNIYSKTGRKIPLVGIAGNHDLIGENLASYNSTTTGLLDSLGIFKMVSTNNPLYFKDENGTVAITGTNYHKGMDKPEYISDYIVPEHLGDVHIHIVHGMLSPTNLGKLIRHTKIEHILDTKADITFCGHDHHGFGIVENDSKYFINPGAIVRLSADIKEINRTVEVVLVEVTGKSISCTEIPLKSALPGTVVIDRTDLDKSEELDSFTNSLKESVKALDIGNNIGMDDILQEIYNEQKISETVRTDINTSIAKNCVTKTSSSKIPVKDTYITKISLKNFQSHEDSFLELDKHLNVIVGESRQGKSSILRALRWVIENKPSGKSFIKTGKTEASVTITLGNGTIIERFVNQKENGYRIFTPDGKVEEGNTKMVSRVQDIIGYSNLEVDDKTSIPLNILKQGDSWYLIGESYSGTDRARILGALKNTNAADASIKEFEKENLQISSEIKKQEIETANLELELSTMTETLSDKELLLKTIDKALIIQKIQALISLRQNFLEKQSAVNQIENAFNEKSLVEKLKVLTLLITKLQNVRKYMNIYSESLVSMKKQLEIVNSLPDVDSLKKEQRNVEDLLQKYFKVVSLINISEKEKEKANLISSYLTKLNVDFDMKTKLLSENVKKYSTIKADYIQVVKSERVIKKANEMITASKIVDDFIAMKNTLNERVNLLERIFKLSNKMEIEEKLLTEKNKKFEQVNLELDAVTNKKIDILLNSHICPTCYSELTADKIKELVPKIKGDIQQ